TQKVRPLPFSLCLKCHLQRRVGPFCFPQHTVASLSDQDVKPSFSMSHLDSSGGPALTLGGYFCPQCQAKYTELPVECKVCGLTLVSAPHLARSFHHLFPLQAFIESPAENYQQNRFCQACQGQLKDKNVFACPLCRSVFCGECDLFIHESLHCCPCPNRGGCSQFGALGKTLYKGEWVGLGVL
uniref:C2H2-type domain-containing protein n=1 Tax=Xiphophorus couchianus TaxID=32473 RepID=A0A3B5M737_9TELE